MTNHQVALRVHAPQYLNHPLVVKFGSKHELAAWDWKWEWIRFLLRKVTSAKSLGSHV
jgi:hypothetical protein